MWKGYKITHVRNASIEANRLSTSGRLLIGGEVTEEILGSGP